MKFAFEIRGSSENDMEAWAVETTRGIREMAWGRKLEAARYWLEAAAARGAADAFDPIEAAQLSNAAIAHCLLGNAIEAERRTADAERAWCRIIDLVATLEIPLTGANSAFHFRLAASRPETLIEARRRRYRQLGEAALALTRFNRLFADRKNLANGVIGERARELMPVLAGILGAASPEARLLAVSAEPTAAEPVSVIYADKLAEVSGRSETFAAALSESCVKVEVAVALTAMLAVPMFTTCGEANTVCRTHHQPESE